MDPFLLLLLGLGGAFTVLSMQVSRQRLQYWEEAAVSCGLRIVERPRGWQPQVRARAGLVSVRIESSGGRGRSPLIVVEAPAPPDFHGVMIRPQTTVEPAREIEIGDRHFDDTFSSGDRRGWCSRCSMRRRAGCCSRRRRRAGS
jgi:hypothetical protein